MERRELSARIVAWQSIRQTRVYKVGTILAAARRFIDIGVGFATAITVEEVLPMHARSSAVEDIARIILIMVTKLLVVAD